MTEYFLEFYLYRKKFYKLDGGNLYSFEEGDWNLVDLSWSSFAHMYLVGAYAVTEEEFEILKEII